MNDIKQLLRSNALRPTKQRIVIAGYLFDGNWILSSIDDSGNYNIFRDINNYWLPAIYSGVFGSLWWFYIPILLKKVILFLKDKVSKLN